MSLPAMVWVLRHSPEKLGRRLVLIALAEFAHDDGTNAWPSVKTLGERACLSRRAVQEALRGLEASGAIERTDTVASGTRVYRVVMDSGGGAESAPGGAVHDAEGARSTTSGGAESAPDPSRTLEQDPKPSADEPPKLVKIDGRNLGFDALAEVCGIAKGSPREREIPAALNGTGRIGERLGIRTLVWWHVIDDLGRAGRAVEEPEWFEGMVAYSIRSRANAYRRRFPGIELTPLALRKWFVDLNVDPGAGKRPDPSAVCEECGATLGEGHFESCSRLAGRPKED